MSLFVLRFLRCDARLPSGEQCETEWSTPTPQPTAADLRAVLRESGWSRHVGRDLCPDHTPTCPAVLAAT